MLTANSSFSFLVFLPPETNFDKLDQIIKSCFKECFSLLILCLMEIFLKTIHNTNNKIKAMMTTIKIPSGEVNKPSNKLGSTFRFWI